MFLGYNKSFFNRILLAGDLRTSIKKEDLVAGKCYKIQTKDGQVIKSVWIDKDRKNLIKAEMNFPSGESLLYEYELKFNTVKLKDVELPDISEYTVKNYEDITE